MKIIRIILIALGIVLWFGPIHSQPNNSYTFFEEEDSVKFYYKWKKKFPFGENAERYLVLYIANNNDYNVSLDFSLELYKHGTIHSRTELKSYCLPSNYEIWGRFRNLAFETDLQEMDLQSDTTLLEVHNIKIKRFEGDCKTKYNYWKANQ